MQHRFFLTRFLVLAAAASLAASCGAGAAAGDTDHVQVTLSQFEVGLTNISGHALLDLQVEIEPTGPASHFTTRVARLESGESRGLAHSNFYDRDSVPFSPRNVRASRVIVTGQDLDGKPVRVEAPFK